MHTSLIVGIVFAAVGGTLLIAASLGLAIHIRRQRKISRGPERFQPLQPSLSLSKEAFTSPKYGGNYGITFTSAAATSGKGKIDADTSSITLPPTALTMHGAKGASRSTLDLRAVMEA